MKSSRRSFFRMLFGAAVAAPVAAIAAPELNVANLKAALDLFDAQRHTVAIMESTASGMGSHFRDCYVHQKYGLGFKISREALADDDDELQWALHRAMLQKQS